MIRVRLHDDDGTPQRVLTTDSLEVATAVNSPGSISFTMSEKYGPQLSAPFVVGVEHGSTTRTYEAPRNNLFIVFEDDSDSVDPTGTRRFTGIGYIPWLLSKLILETHSSAKNGKRKWTDQYPAAPLRQTIIEGKARGWAPWVTLDWDGTADSRGAGWTNDDDETQDFPVGTSAWKILESAVEDGLFDWWTEGTTLRVVHSPFGIDRTDSVRLGGPGYEKAPVHSDASEIITNLYITGDKLKRPVRVANSGATSRFGRLEAAMTVSGVEKESSAIRRANPTLRDSKKTKREMSYHWTPSGDLHRPWMAFQVGDVVTGRLRGDVWEPLRIIRLQVAKAGPKVTASVTVGQKIKTKSTKTASRAANISTGAVIGGSGFVVPSAGRVPSNEPSPPAALAVLENVGYFHEDGTARARVVLGWSEVVTATDATAIDVVAYEVYHRAEAAAGWRVSRVPGTVCEIDTWESGVPREVKVRALSDEGEWSDFSTTIPVTPASPTEVPDPPTAPSMRSELATVTATWDGLLSSGAPRAGWAGVYLELRNGDTGAWVVVGEMKRGGITVPAKKIGAELGDVVWGRLIAVSTIGGESAASPLASVTVGGIDAPDVEANAIRANHLDVGAVRARHMAVGVDETGQRVEMTGSGIRVFNPDGDAVVSIGTDTDDLISVVKKTESGDMTVVAQIDEDGDAAFQNVALSGEVDVQGTPLIGTLVSDPMNGFDLGDVPLLDRFGRGLVASAVIGTSPYLEVNYSLATLAVGQVELLAHRVYQVRVVGPTAQAWRSDGTTGNLLVQCFVGTGSQALTAANTTNGAMSSCVILRSSADTGTGVQEQLNFRSFSPAVSGVFNVMLRIANESNRSWSFVPAIMTNNPTRVEIWDVGAAASFWETESWSSRVTSGGASITPPASKKTIEVAASWSVLWGPSGSIRPGSGNLYDDGRMVQGGNTSLGDGRAARIGFPPLGLSGREALGMWVLLKNRHTANSSATIDLGTHGNSSAPGGSSPNSVNTWTRSFERGQKQWVPIPRSLWSGFMSGAYRGIQIGGPNVNSGKSDYAIFDGFSTTNAATSNGVRPRLKVSYR